MDRRNYQNDDAYHFQPVSERYFLFGDEELDELEDFQRDEDPETRQRFDRRENDRHVAEDHFENRPVNFDSREASEFTYDQSLDYSRQRESQAAHPAGPAHDARTLQGSKVGKAEKH